MPLTLLLFVTHLHGDDGDDDDGDDGDDGDDEEGEDEGWWWPWFQNTPTKNTQLLFE